MGDDPATLLDKLRGVVDNKKDAASVGGAGSWVPRLVILAIGLIAAGVFAWRQWKQAKQLADLLHEKTVREVNQANAAIVLANASDEAAIKKAQMDSEASVQRLEDVQKKLRAVEEQKVRDEEAIGSIRSWSDISRS